jgi:hypothetical protein
VTRKDYVLLAEAFKAARAESAGSPLSGAFKSGIDNAAEYVADALAADNPRFDRARFLRDAGVAP